MLDQMVGAEGFKDYATFQAMLLECRSLLHKLLVFKYFHSVSVFPQRLWNLHRRTVFRENWYHWYHLSFGRRAPLPPPLTPTLQVRGFMKDKPIPG